MARPRTPVGTFGDIEFTALPNGDVRARTRFRDYDGQLRRVEATAPTRKMAEHRLKENVAARADHTVGSGELAADSSFTTLVEVWLEDLDLEGRLAPSTRELYERDMRDLVLPAFANFALREISVRRVDQFIKRLASAQSYSKAKHARTVLSLAFGLAVRYDALRENPVREISRLRPPPSQALALTAPQVEAIRHAVRSWRREEGLNGPKPDGQLEQIIEVMLGTSARIGEVLAIRKTDVDVTGTPATVRLCGTIVSPNGRATHRQDHPKTMRSNRTISVPSFTAEVLRDRLVLIAEEDPEHLIFFSRNHTPLTTNNVRRRLRSILDGVGITGVTPHSFRRTVATVLDRAGGAELAAEMLGHTSSEITKTYYIQPDEKVNPVTAEILESLAPRAGKVDDE
ncbi:site-specific integrase [Aeromicrobium sp. A1-2]|uniref:tyrosine-type recombinase/integrase n=1 Tax=Aeromicrobium sp. A1-2 TaxID=2107713 RepID=UPI000E4834E6|nr:site-specific integrase [Aeromicrobium sp. A1-2]AXT85103.1 site-specific integrase [Aeromicrobium sp. A1-2]